MAKRIQTYFGIFIPPFKEKKLGAGSVTIRFVLEGTVPSKKNSQQTIAVRSDARKYLDELFKNKSSITQYEANEAIKKVYSTMRANDAYKAFLEQQRPRILEQMAWWSERLQKKGFSFPLLKASMSLRFYFHSKHIRDTVNKQQTIQDLLQNCGVIMNDDYNTLNPIYSASACYSDEIIDTITFISLSFRL